MPSCWAGGGIPWRPAENPDSKEGERCNWLVRVRQGLPGMVAQRLTLASTTGRRAGAATATATTGGVSSVGGGGGEGEGGGLRGCLPGLARSAPRPAGGLAAAVPARCPTAADAQAVAGHWPPCRGWRARAWRALARRCGSMLPAAGGIPRGGAGKSRFHPRGGPIGHRMYTAFNRASALQRASVQQGGRSPIALTPARASHSGQQIIRAPPHAFLKAIVAPPGRCRLASNSAGRADGALQHAAAHL